MESDLFVRPSQLPDIETLAWVPQHDDEGEEIGERPVTIALAGEPSPYLTQDRWDEIARARKAPIFNKTIPHFLTSSFLSSDMDEVIAHIITLEAALGLPDDFGGQPKGQLQGAANRLRARITALLDPASGELHRRLVKLRNGYVHGAPLSAIDGSELTEARRLARRVVLSVIERAIAQPTASRSASLNQLLVSP